MKKNIVLIGFMGCGKTTVGLRLARRLNYKFVDCDSHLEEKAGMKIKDIFAQYGEKYFRELEEKTAFELSQLESNIVSTGGGIVKNQNNIKNMKKNGVIVFLNATVDHIYNNVKGDSKRPLLQTENPYETIKTMLEERMPLYKEAADYIINVSGLTFNQIIDDILTKVGDLNE